MSRSNINEGFWDSIVTQAKRGALAVGGAAGNKNAQGKLSALNLSTALYDAFKHYQGETGAEQTEDEMLHFLSKNLGFSDKFAEDQARRFENVMNGYDYDDPVNDADQTDDQGGEEPQATDSADGRKEPTLDDQQTGASDAQNTTPEPSDPKAAEAQKAQRTEKALDAEAEEKSDGEPSTNSQEQPSGDTELKEKRKDSTERFMQTSKYQDVYDEIKGSMATEPVLVLATPENASRIKQTVDEAKANQKLNSVFNQLNGMGAMSSWANLQQLAKSNGIEIPKSKEGMAEFIKDALNQGGKMVGLNYIKAAHLFVMGVPDKPSGQEFKLRESVQLNENLNDKELRDFFLKVSQNALKTGEAKSTAKRQISSAKNRINKTNNGSYRSPGSKSGASQQTNQASQSAGNTTTATADANTISVKLSKADKQLIDELDGTEIVDAIDSDIPDVKALAKKIISGALADYKSKK